MQQKEVTAAEFELCKASGNCPKDQGDGEDDEPVSDVDWHAARAFCRWIGGRLPSDVEWEYAAKSGGSRIYPWGDTRPTAEHAACFKCTENMGSKPVGSFKKGDSIWGLKDMAGNVSEWTVSYGPDAREQEVRGGSWLSHSDGIRASSRQVYETTFRNEMGFRCAW
jgi:formylglycine-generating enzyme required for sulfatase activity